jgi:hypothetical protein
MDLESLLVQNDGETVEKLGLEVGKSPVSGAIEIRLEQGRSS